ncbi:hypothetical protein HJG54_01315 [Leptolyngbya sp. NK1-12]|uniref:Type I restriction enzyme R protein N-terminal domain-containing protein n=1 Tax=Leptolyngbya sp. NK1-12 TaxID=2547451 RepID=A0AA96WS31_9CYAN|nr:hypothetical protein [Leptolyngbya sp. NK1-12]WNZ21642.1 hypothetical protein HJG54_01315 [Leptolyngbya sp. NK1-12]
MTQPRSILQEGQSYTFRSYFEMPYESDEILAEFGYVLERSRLSLPKTTQPLEHLVEFQQRIEDSLLLVSLSSETARRETLVAPVLLEVARYCRCQLRIEYPLMVNNWLRGNLDYLLWLKNSLLVVEAKNDDLTRGFTQLAVEMIALAEAKGQHSLYGAVTIGDAWRFGLLDRTQKRITQDIALYRVPDDLEELVRSLIGMIE